MVCVRGGGVVIVDEGGEREWYGDRRQAAGYKRFEQCELSTPGLKLSVTDQGR